MISHLAGVWAARLPLLRPPLPLCSHITQPLEGLSTSLPGATPEQTLPPIFFLGKRRLGSQKACKPWCAGDGGR